MSRPGTRFFVGPLTPAQQRKRERARLRWRVVDEIADVRNVPIGQAFKIERECPADIYNGYATGEYP